MFHVLRTCDNLHLRVLDDHFRDECLMQGNVDILVDRCGAIQLARAFGATVFATAGSEEKCRVCMELGAERAINYKELDFAQEFRHVDLVLDMVGAPYTPRNLQVLAARGRLVQIAVQQGAEATVNLAKVMQKRLTVTGSTMRPRPIAEEGGWCNRVR